jgi:hypothetical protein
MNLLFSQNLSQLSANYLITPSSYGGFLLRYYGVAAAGVTVALTDCGQVRLNINGDDKINVDVDFLNQADNLYGGYIEFASAIGGAFNVAVYIPTGAWFDPQNVYNLTKDMNSQFILDFPNMTAAVIASGNINISGILQPGTMTYYHKMLSYSVVSAGVSIITNTIAKDNIIELYLKDPSSLISNIQLNKNSITYVNGNILDELYLSNFQHNLESAVTLYACEFANSHNLSQATGNNLVFNYTFIGAGTLAQYYSQIEYLK